MHLVLTVGIACTLLTPSRAIAQRATYRVPSPIPYGHFGWSTIVIPDVDRDGVADIVIGAPFMQLGGTVPGAVYLYSGRTGVLLRTLVGPLDNGRYGYALDSIPDVSGDGVADLIVSAPSGASPTVPGYVRIVNPTDGTVLAETPRMLFHTIGNSISVFRDVNNDGFIDFVATNYGSVMGNEAVDVFSGRTGAHISTFYASTRGGNLSVYARMDYDLDGVPDVVIGDRSFSTGCTFRPSGRVMVRSGLNGSLWWEHVPSCDMEIGTYVSGLPDRNGDRVPEVSAGNGGFGGFCSILSGLNGTHLRSSGSGDLRVAALVGDIDRDGFDDLGIGTAGDAAIYSWRTGAPLVSYVGYLDNGGGRAWHDFNGDGLRDLVAAGDRGLSVHLTGMPLASATPYGRGCPGLFGTPTQSVQGLPTLGSRITLRVDGIRPSMPGAMVIGASRTMMRGVPLPFDLTFIGMPGCSLYSSDELVWGTISTNQWWTFDIAVPVDLVIVGTSAYSQHFHIDPSANVRGVVSSNGMELRVGH